jgi:nitroreductase
MDTLKAIMARRSVRDFIYDPLSKVDIQDLLKAGMQAPSAKNEQPWHFVVIDEPDVLHAIPEFHPYSEMLWDVPLAILVCSELKLDEGSAVQDCSAATQNILLAAHAKGLGAVWLGIYPNPKRVSGMEELLGLPEGIYPVSLIAIGHPASQPDPEDRFKEDRVHYNAW